MPLPDANSSKKVEVGLGATKEFINGFDNGTGLSKLPLYLLLITRFLIFAPYILTMGLAMGAVSLVKGLYDEYQYFLKEKEKRERIAKLEADIQDQTRKLLKLNLHYYNLNKTSKNLILYFLIRDYLDYLDQLGEKRKSNGKYPNQREMLKFMSRINGFDLRQKNFLVKMKDFLREQEKHLEISQTSTIDRFENFYNKVVDVRQLEIDPRQSSKIRKFLNATLDFYKKRTLLRRFIKRSIDFISDGGTGMGIATGMMSLFGIIAATNPITLPLILVVIASGLVVAGISLTYYLVSERKRKKATKALDTHIKERQDQLELFEHLSKVNKHLQFGDNKPHLKNAGINQAVEAWSGRPVKPLSRSFKARIVAGFTGQTILAIALGIVVGMGLIWTLTLMAPVVPFVLPALIVGIVFAGFYVHRALKTEHKAMSGEIKKIRVTEEQQFELESHYGEERVKKIIANNKDNKALLKQVIIDYLNYLNKLNAKGIKQSVDPSNPQKLYKQEKILSLIEKTANIKRGATLKGDDLFYDSLAKYLKGQGGNVNELVFKLKTHIYCEKNPQDILAVNADDPKINQPKTKWEKFKEKGKSFFIFMKDYGLPFLGAIGLALGIPIFLIGPQAAIGIPLVAGVILAGFVLQKIASKRAEKNQQALEDKQLQLSLVERKIKLENKIQNSLQGPNPEKQLEVKDSNNNQEKKMNLKEEQPLKIKSKFEWNEEEVLDPETEKEANLILEKVKPVEGSLPLKDNVYWKRFLQENKQPAHASVDQALARHALYAELK